MSQRDKHARLLELQRQVAELQSELDGAEPPAHGSALDFISRHERLWEEVERVAQLGSWTWNLQSDEVAWSDQLFRIFGVDPQHIKPSVEGFFEAVHPSDRERVRGASARSLQSGVAEVVEFRVLRADGDIREVRMEATFMTSADGSRQHVVGTLIDETEKRRAAALMAQTVAELSEAHEIASLGSWRWYLPDNRVEWSDGMYRILGLSRSERPSEELFYRHVHPDDVEPTRKASQVAVESGIPQQLELRMVRADGVVRDTIMRSRAHFDANHRLCGFQGVLQDVTERKALEDAARHAQKMEAIGTLAGGVAHDFNNYLMVLGGNVDLLSLSLPDDHPGQRSLKAIQFAYERCASLTEQLLTLSRKRTPKPARFDLVALVESMAPVLRSALGPNITLTLRCERETPLVYADSAQVEHALMNLALNARDGIGDNVGEVTIRVEAVCVEPRNAGAFEAGFYVRLSVSDNGCGIPSGLHSRIFEPFFTTKAIGKGTGLGLAVVYGIARDAGGGIELESELGDGSTFHLYLRPAPPQRGDEHDAQPQPLAASGRGQRVLLVEDVALVRDLLRDQLLQASYRVVTADDGVQALALLRAEPFDALVSDVMMPKLGGVELVRLAHQLCPAMPCLLMSGYSTASLSEAGLARNVPLLRKPFSAQQLRAALAELLPVQPI